MMLSLVVNERIRRDPRKLAYLHPRLPLSRYKEQTDEYYQELALKAAEDAARAAGAVLVPSTCLHRRKRQSERRTMIYGRTYYVYQLDDLTPMELEKYKLACEDRGGVVHA